MKKVRKRSTHKSKSVKRNNKFDEEISEDEDIIDDLDVVENSTLYKNNERGELWKYIHESCNRGDSDSDSIDLSHLSTLKKTDMCENGDVTSDKDLFLDRLEDAVGLSGNILDFDQLDENDQSYKWITGSSESNEAYKRLVNKFKQVESDVPEIFKSESQSRANRLERKTQYESVKKKLTRKWAPVVSHISKAETIVYGEDYERSDPTCGTLYSSFKPETDFENQLAQINENKLKLIEGKALARAVLAREQKRNKRINRIKSKSWHKRQKQRDLQIAAKLLTKIDDPDLVSEIKTTFERKRAEKRILRKKEAQTKWAKMALRYGGKDLLKEISFQNQNLKNDHQLIDEVTKLTNQSDADESDADSDEDHDAPEYTLKEAHQDKLNVILDPSVPIPEKGLFNLSFMKDAIESRRLQDLNKKDEVELEDTKALDEDPHPIDTNEDDQLADYSVLVDNEAVDVDYQLIKLNKLKQRNTHEFSKEQIDEAREEVTKRFSDQFSAFNSAEDKTTSKLKSIGYDTTLYTHKSSINFDFSEQSQFNLSKTKHSITNNNEDGELEFDEENPGFKDKDLKNVSVDDTVDKVLDIAIKSYNQEEVGLYGALLDIKGKNDNKILKFDTKFDDFVDSIYFPGDNENEKYVNEMFITRADEDNYLDDSEDEANEDDKAANMAGWGSWTGYGIKNEVKKNPEVEKNKKSRIKVSKRKDPKLSKYYIHNLPHPFNNRHEYNSKMEIPIGPEWNTINMHKKLIQPKTCVKIGSVIMPLGLGNNKHKQLLRDYGKKIIKNRTHSKL